MNIAKTSILMTLALISLALVTLAIFIIKPDLITPEKTGPKPDAVVTSGKLTIEKGVFAVKSNRLRMNIAKPYQMLKLFIKNYNTSNTTRALQSGWKLSQIGLYFCYLNPCNTHAAMLRLSPDWQTSASPTFYVSILRKHNPGATTSRQCGNRGYATLFKSKKLSLTKQLALTISFETEKTNIAVRDINNTLLIKKVLKQFGKCSQKFAVRSDNLQWQGYLTNKQKPLTLKIAR